MLGAAVPVARFAMQAIPMVTAGVSALPALQKGDPLGALVQGGLGYLTGGAVKGGIGALTRAGMRAAPGASAAAQNVVGRVAPNLVDAPMLQAGNIARIARVGLPIAGLAATPMIARAAMGAGNQLAQGVQQAGQLPVQAGAGYIGTQRTQTDYGAGLSAYDQQNLERTLGMQYGLNPTDIFGPRGMSRTAETQREARAQADAMRILNTEEARFLNVAKAKDLERSIAAAVARENIARQSQMLGQAQLGAQDIASKAAAGISQGLMQQYQYS